MPDAPTDLGHSDNPRSYISTRRLKASSGEGSTWWPTSPCPSQAFQPPRIHVTSTAGEASQSTSTHTAPCTCDFGPVLLAPPYSCLQLVTANQYFDLGIVVVRRVSPARCLSLRRVRAKLIDIQHTLHPYPTSDLLCPSWPAEETRETLMSSASQISSSTARSVSPRWRANTSQAAQWI